MRILLLVSLSPLLILGGSFAFAQSANIVGSWQLVKQGSCLDEAAPGNEEASLETLREQMHSRTPVTPQVVNFKENASGTESSRILDLASAGKPKKFYYKFNGDMLLILDKKSQTISDSYIVDKLSGDSLIVSHAGRPCETRIFVKISEEKAN